MTKLETLNKNLENGIFCPYKIDNEYIIFCPFKDQAGDWRDTSLRESLEEAKQCLGKYSGHSQEGLRILLKDAEQLEPFSLIPTHKPKVGDRVVISSQAEELCKRTKINWNIDMNKMIGKEYEIDDVSASYVLIYEDNNNDFFWTFPHNAFYYKDRIERTADDILRELSDEDREILKSKLK